MTTRGAGSDVLTIRIPREVSQRLAREARRRRQTRSAVARDLLAESLGDDAERDLQSEARRQSLLVRRRKSEKDALRIASDLADLRGWK
jgi:predicted transcriptional regulator